MQADTVNVGLLAMSKRCDFRAKTRTAETAVAGANRILGALLSDGLLLLSAP
jgi:hypothetical protein